MEETPAAPRSWSDGARIAFLLLFAAGLHAWLMAHTTVAARDSIGYIRYALLLEAQPLSVALPKMDQHPGYPLALLAVSLPVRYFWGGTTCDALVFSAQLTSALAGVLLVVPMYYLGRLLFDRRVGFWAALLFQSLPVGAHIMGDALSEATFFLFLATTLLLAALALRDRSVLYWLLCGFCGSLAYLTRPEGALAIMATLAVLVGMQTARTIRWPARRFLACTAALLVGAGSLAAPYIVTIGHITAKPTPKKWIDGTGYEFPPEAALPMKATTSGALLAVWLPIEESHRTAHALYAVFVETVRAYQYVVWLPALLGLWWFRDRWRSDPGALVVLVYCLVHALVLWRMASVVGYVSERHALPLLLGGSFWAAAALVRIADGIVAAIARTSFGSTVSAWKPAATAALLLLATGFALPVTFKPLHANRVGHREAGRWLAEHAAPDDYIVDPYCWAHFYAGKVLREQAPPSTAIGASQWIVLEESHNPHARLLSLPEARHRAENATVVYRWTPNAGNRKDKAEEVVVYRMP